jgi:hypothetical protein
MPTVYICATVDAKLTVARDYGGPLWLEVDDDGDLFALRLPVPVLLALHAALDPWARAVTEELCSGKEDSAAT